MIDIAQAGLKEALILSTDVRNYQSQERWCMHRLGAKIVKQIIIWKALLGHNLKMARNEKLQ